MNQMPTYRAPLLKEKVVEVKPDGTVTVCAHRFVQFEQRGATGKLWMRCLNCRTRAVCELVEEKSGLSGASADILVVDEGAP
jgi:hypothetical protein